MGAFNCQGGGWCRETRRNKCASEYSRLVSSTAGPSDIEWKQGTDAIPVEGVETFAMYLFRQKKLVLAKPTDAIKVSLEPFNFELITVSPVSILSEKSIEFAPIGLVNMLNTGGAIHSLEYGVSSVKIGVKGSGEMRAYASERPLVCRVNGASVTFEYLDKMVLIQVPWPNNSGISLIQYLF